MFAGRVFRGCVGVILVLGISLSECPANAMDLSSVVLRCYNRTMDDFDDIPLMKASGIYSSRGYTPERPTKFYTFGYTGKALGPATTAVITALLETNSFNVILVNWEDFAGSGELNFVSGYLNRAIPNTKNVGEAFGAAIVELEESGVSLLNNSHFIGHSLGAHLFGITGHYVRSRGFIVPRITGLDPARVGFEPPRAARELLDAGSAAYVDIVHSDPGNYGYRKPHGTVDYWPNVGNQQNTVQPGCPTGKFPRFSPQVSSPAQQESNSMSAVLNKQLVMDLCSHNRAWEFLVESLGTPGSIVASGAAGYRAWVNSSPASRLSKTLHFLQEPVSDRTGNFYFTTNPFKPFGKNEEGLHPF